MTDRRLLNAAIAELADNRAQSKAVAATGACVVLAGPGSGKTKTLTVAMARALADDVVEPRGIACITYNNECALELEGRLARLGIQPDRRVFVGTVHGFALSQVILPYARCVLPDLAGRIAVATEAQRRAAVELAYFQAIGGAGDPHSRWRFAETKRRTHVDRSAPEWRGSNPELADFVEAYESSLRGNGLIDYDDMTLLALRMVREHAWIRDAIAAKYPVLFVDEYQDLGHALHALVLELCFGGNMRLFAVGDPDQSMYSFLGAEPALLMSLSQRPGVTTFRLRTNYRSGTSIISASIHALNEARDYVGLPGAEQGIVDFHPVSGALGAQADFVAHELIPSIRAEGIAMEEIAVLYRTAKQGAALAEAGRRASIPFVRADNQALVKRNSLLARFLEACAGWQTGGWKDADTPFRRLAASATRIVYGSTATEEERHLLQVELIRALHTSVDPGTSTHDWLSNLREEVAENWRRRCRTLEEWTDIDTMIERTDTTLGGEDVPLSHFGGRGGVSGRLNLSTLHSAKGREFDAVVLFGMNADVIPNAYENTPAKRREPRRLFYVGVTRPRKRLHIVFRDGNHSPFVAQLYQSILAGDG